LFRIAQQPTFEMLNSNTSPTIVYGAIMSRIATPLGSLLPAVVHTNVQYVASTQNDVSEVCGGGVASILDCPIKNYVHVTVAVDHLPSVLDIVLQPDRDVGVQLLNQNVQWLP